MRREMSLKMKMSLTDCMISAVVNETRGICKTGDR